MTSSAAPNAYDLCLARRALALAALVSALVVLVVATTDEGAGWAKRAALCAMLAPVAGALGAFGACAVARARGELRALEALGAHPTRASLGAALGGALVGFVGAALVLGGVADLEPLFPRPLESESSTWIAAPGGGMRDVARGVFVGPGGLLVVEPPIAAPELASALGDRPRAVALALSLLSIAAPLSAIREEKPSPRRAALLVALGVALIAAFQVVAARLASVWVLEAPPLVLLANALASRYRPPPIR